jgi:tetratricopeptide (TPR) repeat protein
MLKKYAADVVAHNNVAFCQTQKRQMSDAVTSMRRATGILPKRALYRLNLALYLAYATDFPAAETEATATQDLGNTYGLLPAAFAQLGQERAGDALRTYEQLMNNPQAASTAASGIADLAVYEGRFADAVRLYESGARTDIDKENPERAAAKLAGLAYAELQRQRPAQARAAAAKAIAASQAIRPRLLAARVLVEAGDFAGAEAVVAALTGEMEAEARASAKVLQGTIAIKKGDNAAAIAALTEANTILDTWIGQFEMGRARLAAGQHNAADSAFDRCITRSGELFLDEEPTYGLLPAVFYLQGQTREAAKSVGYADLYRRYLRIREKAGEDPVLKDVRRRAGG